MVSINAPVPALARRLRRRLRSGCAPAPTRPGAARIRGAFAVGVLLAALAGPAQAEPDGPFDDLPGSWSGNGTIAMSNGTKERIRCQANYRLESSTQVDLRLSCSSDSYKFELQSDTVASGQALSGNWIETTRRVSGQLVGRISGNRLNLRAESQTFNALLDMTTRGNRQAISIRSPGSEMSEVSISLTRRSR